MDGILGLAYGSISVNGLPTFIDSAENLSEKTFTFNLRTLPEPSTFIIPGYDESLFKSELQYHDVVE